MLINKKRANLLSPFVGKTFESKYLRVHVYTDVIQITDLQYAGKRGKQVEEIWLSNTNSQTPTITKVIAKLIEAMQDIRYAKALDLVFQIEELSKERKKIDFLYTPLKVSLTTRRGIDVLPSVGSLIRIETPRWALEASPTDFTLKLHHTESGKSDPNEPTCIPALKGKRKQGVKLFYEWVSLNQDKIRNMSFYEIQREMTKLGIAYYDYCAID